jgi:hypothetical protein
MICEDCASFKKYDTCFDDGDNSSHCRTYNKSLPYDLECDECPNFLPKDRRTKR